MLDAIYHAIDPVAFSVGPFSVRWYGIAYILGFFFAAVMMRRASKRWGIAFDLDSILTIITCLMVCIIVGARLGYCLFYDLQATLANPLSIFMIQNGGMSFHGGLVGALLSAIPSSYLTKIPILTIADLGAIGAPIGLFFGRCANFINGELWGAPTDLPWGVVFGGQAGMMPRHPSQLYEALLEGVVLFAILLVLSRKKPPRPQGTFLGVFLLCYGIVRIAMDFIRQPDVQIGYLLGDVLTMGQLLSIPLVIAGAILLAWSQLRKCPQQGLKYDTE